MNECKELPKDNKPKDEPPKENPETKTAVAVELDCEDCGAWSVKLINDEMDWFESAIAEMDALSCIEDAVSVEIPVWDWFYKVTEDQDESEGLHQDEVLIAHAVESEGEYQGDGNTCESSGWMPDLDIRTAEIIACLLGNHKRGEDNSTMKMSEIERNVYKEYSSVPHFEGEEENTSEMRDLPVVPIPGIAAPDPLSAIEILNLNVSKSFLKVVRSFPKILELSLRFCRFHHLSFRTEFYCWRLSFWSEDNSEHIWDRRTHFGCHHRLGTTPSDVFELEGERPYWMMKTSILLISFLDAFDDRGDHAARACYFWYVDSAEGRISACISLRVLEFVM